ncbi:MAG: superoxide dismutase [Oscillospiraceae bacterium]
MNEHYPFVLPPLPYPYDSLEPQLDAATMALHHDRHFAAYVEQLNRALAPYPAYWQLSLEALLLGWAALPDTIRQTVRENAGGVYHHSLYFDSLSPAGKSSPQPPLSGAIAAAFGSEAALRSALRTAALSVFGSGWVTLAADGAGRLSLIKTGNQDTALPLLPLLVVDVWEHAHYLRYQNRRGEYFDNWYLKIDWGKVSRRYAAHLTNRPPYPLP